jgi:hypothetical protein
VAALLSVIICLMLPMEELAPLPLLWGREQIRESKRDIGSGSLLITVLCLMSVWSLSCPVKRRLDQPLAYETWICRLVRLGDCQLRGCFCAGLF